MSFGGGHFGDVSRTSMQRSCVSGGAAPAKNAHKKYCSILQYIQHNNRELYDAINDICPTLSGIFSLKSFGSSPGKRDLTMLMPKPGSEMHKELISMAYGGREHEAIAMLKSCLLYKHVSSLGDFKQGDVLKTANRDSVVVDTSGGFVKIGGAKIIADENFAMLYTDAKFHVYLLESGILMTTPGAEPKDDASSISGGAWKELRDEKESSSFMRTPAGLAKNALTTHLIHLGASERTDASMPGWIKGQPNDVFYRWGISLAKFLERKHGRLGGLVRKLYHPNPMCVIPFTALFVPKGVFDEWLNDDEEAAGSPTYSYAEYLSFVPKEPLVAESVAGPVIAAAVKSVHPDKSGQKSMNETARIVVTGYNTAYANDAELPWATKLLYDEAVFVMNTYVRTAAIKSNGWQEKCKTLSEIIVNHYSSPGSKRWLTETGDSRADSLSSGAMHCKLLEFVLSESFMYPNGYCARFNRPSGLVETAEDAMKLANMNDIKCADFTGQLKTFFGSPPR